MSGAFLQAGLDGEMAGLVQAFQTVVADSFKTHPVRHFTVAEVKRRVGILEKHFRAMREELKWSTDRSLSQLRAVLEAELNGQTWAPPTRHKTLWTPDLSLVKA